MENFIVSARKYRPVKFDTVIGQKSITTTLKNAIRQNQLAQAFLFCGPRGVGKTTCARILAKTINCQNVTENIEPCEECESCRNFNTTASFNIYELDAASNNSVDDIRNLVDQVRIPPQTGKYKVYIIDEVHMLSAAAFNAFLKTLEEPPAYAKFILATTEKHKIIPTILSRCQIFDFKRIGVEDIVAHLKYVAETQQVITDEDSLHIIAQKADGAMRDALSIFDQIVSFSGKEVTYEKVIENLNVLDYDYYFRLTEFVLNGNYTEAVLLINDISERGFDGQHFISGLGSHFRDLLMCKDASTVRLLEVGENIKGKYIQLAGECPANFLLRALEINNQFDLNYKNSNNKRLHLELLVIQMCMINASIAPETEKKNIVVDKSVPAPAKQQPTTPKPAPTPSDNKPPVTQSTPTLGKKSLSLKEMMMAPAPAAPVAPQDNTNQPKEIPKNDFSQEALELVWNKFAEIHGKSSPTLYLTLSHNKPTIKENFELELMLESKLQEEELTTRINDLLTFLRNGLDNHTIELNIIISSKEKEVKPYTPIEKFTKMAGTNPAIIALKEKLDLDIDY